MLGIEFHKAQILHRASIGALLIVEGAKLDLTLSSSESSSLDDLQRLLKSMKVEGKTEDLVSLQDKYQCQHNDRKSKKRLTP